MDVKGKLNEILIRQANSFHGVAGMFSARSEISSKICSSPSDSQQDEQHTIKRHTAISYQAKLVLLLLFLNYIALRVSEGRQK